MDYHAWFLLEKSLGILEYGNEFNRAVVTGKSTRNKATLFTALLKLFNKGQQSAVKNIQTEPIPAGKPCCNA